VENKIVRAVEADFERKQEKINWSVLNRLPFLPVSKPKLTVACKFKVINYKQSVRFADSSSSSSAAVRG